MRFGQWVRIGWHPRIGVGSDALQQQAVGSVAGFQGGATFASPQRLIPGVQTQASLGTQGPVAPEAVDSQDRFDIPQVIDGGWRPSREEAQDGKQRDQE